MGAVYQDCYLYLFGQYRQQGLCSVEDGPPGIRHVVYNNDGFTPQFFSGHFQVDPIFKWGGWIEADTGKRDVLVGDGQQGLHQHLGEDHAIIIDANQNELRLLEVVFQDFDGQALDLLLNLTMV